MSAWVEQSFIQPCGTGQHLLQLYSCTKMSFVSAHDFSRGNEGSKNRGL
jgi:hypothetical protein